LLIKKISKRPIQLSQIRTEKGSKKGGPSSKKKKEQKKKANLQPQGTSRTKEKRVKIKKEKGTITR